MDQRVLIGGNKQTNIRKITEKKKKKTRERKETQQDGDLIKWYLWLKAN